MPLSTIFQLYCGSQFYIFEVILTTFREDIEVLDPILMRDNESIYISWVKSLFQNGCHYMYWLIANT
jgi:hypothetical protein